jgi:hypothetical protein
MGCCSVLKHVENIITIRSKGLKDMCHLGARGIKQEDLQTVLREAGEAETMQENIQDWLELDEGDPGFQLLTEEEIAAVIFPYLYY